MSRFFFSCAIGFLALMGLYWLWATVGAIWVGSSSDVCLDLYQKNARTPVFSGFITMGSFLLALKTSILARLKETYDTQEYRNDYRAAKEDVAKGGMRYYGSLERLSRAIGWNVIFCLITASAQMTLGFIWAPWAFAICAALATGTLVLLLYLTHILMSAHQEWFDMIETKAQTDLQNLDKANEKAMEREAE